MIKSCLRQWECASAWHPTCLGLVLNSRFLVFYLNVMVGLGIKIPLVLAWVSVYDWYWGLVLFGLEIKISSPHLLQTCTCARKRRGRCATAGVLGSSVSGRKDRCVNMRLQIGSHTVQVLPLSFRHVRAISTAHMDTYITVSTPTPTCTTWSTCISKHVCILNVV